MQYKMTWSLSFTHYYFKAETAYICNCWSITVPNTLKGRPVIAGASVSKHTVSHPVQLCPTVRASKVVFKGDALSTVAAHVTTVIHSYCRKHNVSHILYKCLYNVECAYIGDPLPLTASTYILKRSNTRISMCVHRYSFLTQHNCWSHIPVHDDSLPCMMTFYHA